MEGAKKMDLTSRIAVVFLLAVVLFSILSALGLIKEEHGYLSHADRKKCRKRCVANCWQQGDLYELDNCKQICRSKCNNMQSRWL